MKSLVLNFSDFIGSKSQFNLSQIESKIPSNGSIKEVTNEEDIPEVLIFGDISKEAVNYKEFQEAFKMVVNGYSKIKVRINSDGGSMIEGFAIVDLMRKSNCEVIGINEGMAASMAGVILQGCDIREVTENSTKMIHAVSGAYYGSADGLRSYANFMQTLQEKVIKLFMEKSKQPEAVVRSWFVEGKETFLTAQECIKLGLADRITPTKQAKGSTNPAAKNMFVNNQYSSNPLLKGRNDWTYHDWEMKDPKGLGEIMKQDRTLFNALLDATYGNHEVEKNTASIKVIPESRKDWTYHDWEMKDPRGLGEMRKNDETRFNNLLDKYINN